MARPKRWTSTGGVKGEAVQPPLFLDPWQALHAAGWEVAVGGDDQGVVWGHATRTRSGVVTVLRASGRTPDAVLEQLWRDAGTPGGPDAQGGSDA